MNDKLRNIAFRIHIDPVKEMQESAKAETVVKVLSNIIKSYKNYLKIEFLKQDDFKKIYSSNPKTLDSLMSELELLVVDLNFGSFEAALAPNIVEDNSSLFINEVLDWKKETFDNYKDVVIMGDYDKASHLSLVSNRYNERERYDIFNPFFTSVGDGKEYNLNINNEKHQIIKLIKRPEKNRVKLYSPPIINKKVIPEYGIAQVYLKIKKGDKEPNITKNNIKEILFYEELEHDTYPFNPEIIKFEDFIFLLTEHLECEVKYEEDSYLIANNKLDIIVWGETRKEVEEAFSFSFYSIYLNYYLEKNENLSKEAIELKQTIKSIIKKVINEAS